MFSEDRKRLHFAFLFLSTAAVGMRHFDPERLYFPKQCAGVDAELLGSGCTVAVVAPGVVAYIGDMRGYGNFLIVEHEDGFYSMYSGLDDLYVGLNQIVDRGEKLGSSSTGEVRFELRQGREAVDPMEWLKIDSF